MASKFNFKRVDVERLPQDELQKVQKDDNNRLHLKDNSRNIKDDASEEELNNLKLEKKIERGNWAQSGYSKLVLAEKETHTNSNTNTKKVMANFFEVTLAKDIDLWKYSISLGSFKGRKTKSKAGKRAFIEYMLLAKQNEVFKNKSFATDYDSTIISVGELFDGTSLEILHQPYPNAPEDKHVLSVINSLGKLNFTKLKSLVGPTTIANREKEEEGETYLPDDDIKALNIATWKKINESGWIGGRVGNKFFPVNLWESELQELEKKRKLPGNKIRYRKDVGPYWLATGFFTSIRPGQKSLLLNVNVTTSAFYAPITVAEFLAHRTTSFRDLIGRKVVFSKDEEKKQRVIRQVDRENIDRKTCKIDDKTLLVVDHLKRKYGLKIGAEEGIPSVNCGPPGGREEWYPATQLKIVPWQHVQGNIHESYKNDMVKVSERNPSDVKILIEQNAFEHLDMRVLKEFGLVIAPGLKTIIPRNIKPPVVLYDTYPGNLRSDSVRKTAQGSNKNPANVLESSTKWNLGSVKTFTYVKRNVLKNLHFIEFGDGDELDDRLKRFIPVFEKKLNEFGILAEGFRSFEHAAKLFDPKLEIPQPKRKFFNHVAELALSGVMNDLRKESKDEEDKKTAQERKKSGKARVPPPPLLFVVLPKKDDTIYPDVKWWGDCNRGIPTMCITYDTIWKAMGYEFEKDKNGKRTGHVLDEKGPDPMVLANLCMKVNFKLGGRNSTIQDGLGLKPNTMVVGADVTHYTNAKDKGCPSLAGVVACAVESSFDYLPSARLQSNKTEFIEKLEEMMTERLTEYEKLTGNYPAHILFYRDGVGQSQYGMVHDRELHQIEAAAQAAVKSKTPSPPVPQITLLVVGKRHHARFFPATEDRYSKDKNLDGGTCVNSEVIAPKHFNFYLQSHDSPKATARSAHYVVIKNDSGYSPQELQDVTNKLCYTGSRATSAQSTCIPVKYADLLCTRIRCYMKPVQDGDLIEYVKNGDIEDYLSHKTLWYSEKDKSEKKDSKYNFGNPWRESMNGTMFYL